MVLQKLNYYSYFFFYIDSRPRCLIALSLAWRQKSISADDRVVFAEIIYFAFGLRYMLYKFVLLPLLLVFLGF